MTYAEMLKKAISESDLNLAQIIRRLHKRGFTTMHRSVLSKMQNGKYPPAKDEVNIALAEILEIDATEFRLAAARQLISPELIKLIKKAG